MLPDCKVHPIIRVYIREEVAQDIGYWETSEKPAQYSMRDGPEGVAEVKPCNDQVPLVMFGFFYGSMEEMSVLLYATHSGKKAFLLRRNPPLLNCHLHETGRNNTGE